jgi:hypothetical protein
MRSSLGVAALVTFVSCATEASAQSAAACGNDAAQSSEFRAFDCQKKGKEQYEQGRFREALAFFRRADEIFAQPLIVRSIARTCEQLADQTPDRRTMPEPERAQKLADLRCAADTYETYLAQDPVASDAPALRLLVGSLRARIAAILEPDPRPAKPLPSTPEVEEQALPYPWIIHGAGMGAVTAGVVLGVLSRQRLDDARDPTTDAISASRLQEEHADFAVGADIAFGIGGSAALVGLVWGIIDIASLSGSSSAAVTASPPQLRVGVGGVEIIQRF